MSEYRFYPEGETPFVSTFEFHRDRDRAAHLENGHHLRLNEAARMVREAMRGCSRPTTVSDLGCGDGGLLSLLKDDPDIHAWGYDFSPANIAGARERGVDVSQRDIFNRLDRDVALGEITVMTEVLEHLADPHAAVRWVGERSTYLVASSPWGEHPGSHDACHAWAWDQEGYLELLAQGGFLPVRTERVGWCQFVLARQP